MYKHLRIKLSRLLLAATIPIRLVALSFVIHDSSKHVLDKCKSLCFLVNLASPRSCFAHQLHKRTTSTPRSKNPISTFQTSPSTSAIQRTPIQSSRETTRDSCPESILSLLLPIQAHERPTHRPSALEKKPQTYQRSRALFLLLHISSHIPHLESTLPL